jgi:hypothetical protein
MRQADFSCLKANWGSGIVARKEVGRFTGGMLSPRHLANLDCEGNGPANAFRIGRQVGYYVDDLIEWLEKRSQSGVAA